MEIWMSIVGISMSLAGFPQIYRMWKRKTSDDLSITLWVIVIHGMVWWLYYGMLIGSVSLVITNAVCLVLDSIVLAMIIKYRYRNESKEDQIDRKIDNKENRKGEKQMDNVKMELFPVVRIYKGVYPSGGKAVKEVDLYFNKIPSKQQVVAALKKWAIEFSITDDNYIKTLEDVICAVAEELVPSESVEIIISGQVYTIYVDYQEFFVID